MSHELFIICWEQQLAEVGMGQVPLGGTAYQLCWQPAPMATEEGKPAGLCSPLRISPSSEASSPTNRLSYDFTK